MNRILVINSGSTSTKVAVFEEERLLFTETIRHSAEELRRFADIEGQLPMRKRLVEQALEAHQVRLHSLSDIVARGGLIRPIESGTYRINERMLCDMHTPTALGHASVLGGMIAHELSEELGIPAYVVDPVMVDELEPVARFSGLAGIERRSVFHALNTKAILRRAAADLGTCYEDCCLIAVHMGGGITVSAHRYGRVIDVNDAMGGDGAFTPDRTGSLPVVPIIEMCYSGNYSREEMLELVQRRGGLYSYLGTNDMIEADNMVKQGDEFAAMVVEAMAYQICKEIGAMYAVLEGRAKAVVLTGGIAHSTRFTGMIKKRVDNWLPVLTYAGEDEMRALAEGVLRVKNGKERLYEY